MSLTASGVQTLVGLAESLPHGRGPSAVITIIGTALFFTLVILVHVLMVKIGRRRQMLAGWQEFARRLAEGDFSRAEKKMLGVLARREVPLEPQSITERAGLFERAVHRYLRPRVRTPAQRRHPSDAAKLIHALRRKLDFGQTGGAVFFSTRTLAEGLHLDLSFGDGPTAATASAQLGRHREDLLELSDLHPGPGPVEGQRIEVSFSRDGDTFGFTSAVMEVDAEARSCMLAHSLNVRRADV